MGRAKVKAPCRAALLGERKHFFMLPRCVVDSAAYRDLSVHARAALVEIGVRSDGFNNGTIGIDQRSIMQSLRCSPRKVVQAVCELVEHGLIDVTAEGRRLEKLAREYRLTFVSTPNAPATNDYVHWTPTPRKSGATGAVTEKAKPATGAVTKAPKPATHAVTEAIQKRRKCVDDPPSSVTDAVPHIISPYPTAQSGERKGDSGHNLAPLKAVGQRCTTETCEHCNEPIAHPGRGACVKRFCSEPCRKAAETTRGKRRKKHGDEGAPIGAILNGHVAQVLRAGARA